MILRVDVPVELDRIITKVLANTWPNCYEQVERMLIDQEVLRRGPSVASIAFRSKTVSIAKPLATE